MAVAKRVDLATLEAWHVALAQLDVELLKFTWTPEAHPRHALNGEAMRGRAVVLWQQTGGVKVSVFSSAPSNMIVRVAVPWAATAQLTGWRPLDGEPEHSPERKRLWPRGAAWEATFTHCLGRGRGTWLIARLSAGKYAIAAATFTCRAAQLRKASARAAQLGAGELGREVSHIGHGAVSNYPRHVLGTRLLLSTADREAGDAYRIPWAT